MEHPAGANEKKIVIVYTDNGGSDIDIRLDSEGFGGDVEQVTIYLHKTIQAILNSEEALAE